MLRHNTLRGSRELRDSTSGGGSRVMARVLL